MLVITKLINQRVVTSGNINNKMKIKIKFYTPIINFPDMQGRIYKNKESIQWGGTVHERIQGTINYSHLPMEEYWTLYHPKTIERQEKQNNYYNTL